MAHKVNAELDLQGNKIFFLADGEDPQDAITLGQLTTHEASIDNHNDVDTTTAAPSTGNTFRWDGTNWVPTGWPLVQQDAGDPGRNVYVQFLVDPTPPATTRGDVLIYEI